MGTIIEASGLTKKYGDYTAVDHLDLEIREGEVFGLLGPNGAGKSTTILMTLGLTEPDSGSVRVCGFDSTVQPIEVKKRVGYMPEDVGFYDDLDGRECLVLTARLNGMSAREGNEKAEELLERVGLSGEAGKKTGKYSRGMRQRLGLADILIKNPRVIILDEPTLGIDPTGVREFLNLIITLSKEEGLTVLLSSHHLHQVQQVCDRVGLFVRGKLIALGEIQDLSRQLFGGSPYTIEADIIPGNSGGEAKTNGKQGSREWLQGILKGIDGIVGVRKQDKTFLIECSRDLTTDIARTVATSGAGIRSLNRKQYGLDDIYYRYFEGGSDHE